MLRTVLGRTALALGAAGVGAFAWGSLVERNSFRVRREIVPVLAPGSHPITVLHLSDLHLAPWQHRKAEWVRSLTLFRPDFVVNTGDNLGHPDAIDMVAYALEPLRGIPGVWVNGSNDYFGPTLKNPFTYFTGPSKRPARPTRLDTPRLETVFRDLGWRSLNNAATSISVAGTRLELFGVDDPHIGYDRLELLPGVLDELRESAQATDEPVLTVGVTHAPYQRALNSFVTHGAELIFAGHTHGGQVCIPGFGALVTNCDLPRKKVAGLSSWNHALHSAVLNVSAGIGTSIYAPVRFACKPEAVIVTLVGSDIGYS